MSDTPTIDHWIDGKRWEGTGERTQPGLRPGHRRGGRRGAAGLGGRRRHHRRLGPGRVRLVALGVAHQAHRRAVRLPRGARTAARRSWPRSSPPSTARCSPTPAARCSAASRWSTSPAASRSCSRAATPSRRRPTSTCTRSASRSASPSGITPFNFPAMVPLWMCPVAIACGNAFILKPSERDPGAVAAAGRAVGRGRPARRRVQRAARATPRRSTPCSSTPASTPRRFVGSTPDRPPRVRDGGPHRQAGAGARRRQEPHDRAARRRPRRGRRRRGERRLRLGRRAVHGHLGRRGRRPGGRRAGGRDRRARTRTVVVGDGRSPDAEMGPLVTAVHRDKVRGYVDAGEAEGAVVVVDGRDLSVDGRPDGLLARARPCSTRSTTEMSVYRDEIFGPVLCVVRVPTPTTRRSQLVERQRLRQRRGHLHPRRRRRPAVHLRGRGRHGRRQRADPGADGVLLVRRVGRVALRRHPRARRRGRALLHAWQGGHDPLGRPRDPRPRPRLPHPRPDDPTPSWRRPSRSTHERGRP